MSHTRILVIAIVVGLFVAGSLFTISAASILLVRGDGTAPGISHFVLSLIDGYASATGAQESLVGSSLFWGAIFAVLVFVLLELVQAVRRLV